MCDKDMWKKKRLEGLNEVREENHTDQLIDENYKREPKKNSNLTL